jgi:hypothetical protein
MRTESGGYRRDYLRTLTQRVEVARKNFASGVEKRTAAHTRPRLKHKTASFGLPNVLYRGGAPRSTKVGNIASPWRYDAAAYDTPTPSNTRPIAISAAPAAGSFLMPRPPG